MATIPLEVYYNLFLNLKLIYIVYLFFWLQLPTGLTYISETFET